MIVIFTNVVCIHGFNTFSTSSIINEVKKVKLLSHKGFSLGIPVATKMDKVELRSCNENIHSCDYAVYKFI